MNLVTVKPGYVEDYPWPTPLLYLGDVEIPIDPVPVSPPLTVTNAVVIDSLSQVHFVPIPDGVNYHEYFDDVVE